MRVLWYNFPEKVFKKLGGSNPNEHTNFEGVVHILRILWAGGGLIQYGVKPFLKKSMIAFLGNVDCEKSLVRTTR